MKICVTSRGESLESEVDSRFGRCRFFIIVDTDTLDFEVVENQYAGISGGAAYNRVSLYPTSRLKQCSRAMWDPMHSKR